MSEKIFFTALVVVFIAWAVRQVTDDDSDKVPFFIKAFVAFGFLGGCAVMTVALIWTIWS